MTTSSLHMKYYSLYITGSTKCIWNVQESKCISNEIDKKGWYPDDLLLFRCYDTKWDVHAHYSGKYSIFFSLKFHTSLCEKIWASHFYGCSRDRGLKF